MYIEVEFVELETNYVKITDGIGNIHYIDDHLIDEQMLKEFKKGKIEVGTQITLSLPEHYIRDNGMVDM